MSSFSDAEVHANLPPVQLYSIQCLPRFRSIINRLEVDEREASAAASVTVQDDLNLLQGAEPLELGLQLPLAGVETQSEHSETLARLRRVSGALVAPPVGHRRPGVVTAVLEGGKLTRPESCERLFSRL